MNEKKRKQEVEGHVSENMFGTHVTKSTERTKYCSLRTFNHRLFHFSSVTDESKHGYDMVYNLVHRKKSFQSQWASKYRLLESNNYIGTLKKLHQEISLYNGDMCLQLPEYIPKCVEFIQDDPDENFFGKYNWLYTGGCIQHFNLNDNLYLAHVEGKSKDCLHVAPLKYVDQFWSIDKSNVQKVIPSPKKEIFQVLCVEKPSNNFVGIRQRDSCVVYNFCENGRIGECFNLLEVPLVSFDISSVHDELCTISMTQKVSYWDMNREELPMTTYFPGDNPHCDNWHNLWYSADPSVISIAGRKSLKWMERRSSNVVNSVQLTSLKGNQRHEEICMHFASKCNPYLIYVSTDVHLFVLDTRSPLSVIHCWTHYLPTPPLYSCVIPYDKNEIVCIGNQYPGNLVLAFSSKSETRPPVKLPSRIDSLISLQASGLCLDPSVMPRMTVGLTGMTYLKCEKSSNIELLTHTAASDIFSQSLFDQNIEVKSDNLNGLVSTKEVLHASERWNLGKLYKELSKVNIQPNPPTKRRTRKQPWQLSKQELLEYKDALAPLMLEVWEVDKVNGKSGISSEQKVNAWLDSSFNTVYSSQGGHYLREDE